jgi:hypothetical protein
MVMTRTHVCWGTGTHEVSGMLPEGLGRVNHGCRYALAQELIRSRAFWQTASK